MAIYKCKMCGGTIEFSQGDTIGVCDSCGTKQTLPTTNDEVITNLHNRATTLRLKCEFDKAEEIYDKILINNPNDAEAHWGIILCKYGIEYVEDPKTYKRVPTCHRTSFEAILADEDYKMAIENANYEQRELYEKEAKEIDRIQKDILAIVKNEKPFDVFICYKETDENGRRTQDSVIANDIYYQLVQEGFKVFYAAITLEDKLGQEYEPYIFAALNSAKVMLVVGSKSEYFTSVWVKNEWSRYIKLMKTDRSKLLIPCYKDIDAYELPEEFAHLQAQDMSKIGFINDIVRGIKKVVCDSSNESATKETIVVNGNNVNIAVLLKRAFMSLEDGEWDKANYFCEQVLNQDPENAQAYLGKLMLDMKVGKKENLKNCDNSFEKNNNYQKAVRFGDKDLPQYITYINERNEYARNEEIYNSAISEMKKDSEKSLIIAVKNFSLILEYKDSKELVEKCSKRKEELKKERLQKEEEMRIAAEKKEEEMRIAAEKASKKREKIFITFLAIACVCVAVFFVLKSVVIPSIKYNKAMSLIEKGNFKEGYEKFAELNDYKDSSKQAKNAFEQYKIEKLENSNIGDIVYLGVYEQDNNTSNGKENIEWIVLAKENNKALLISKYVLDGQLFNNTWKEITWEDCDLRGWLNDTFINEAFSSKEQSMIVTTYVTADKNPKYDTDPGNPTEDKIFLLSIDEVEKYFSSNEEIRINCEPTKYANLKVPIKYGSFYCEWWLRSPGSKQVYATYFSGKIDYIGTYNDSSDVGVRPALWINLES